jgi:hypothetical protein
MFTSRRLITAAAAVALLSGCASQNPYDNQGQAQGSSGISKTAKYGGLGALAGAVAGAAIDHNNRGKGALIGAAVAGAASAGYGYYADRQEAALRESMANTGVEVQRQGDQIKLIMPGNITFATDSSNISSSFYTRTTSKSSATPTVPVPASTTWTCRCSALKPSATTSRRKVSMARACRCAAPVPTSRSPATPTPTAARRTAASRSTSSRFQASSTRSSNACGSHENPALAAGFFVGDQSALSRSSVASFCVHSVFTQVWNSARYCSS